MAMELVSTTHWDRQDVDSSKPVLFAHLSFPTKHTPTKCSCFVFPQLFEFQIVT